MDFSISEQQSVLKPVSTLILIGCNVTNLERVKEFGKFYTINLWECELDEASIEALWDVYIECECSRMFVNNQTVMAPEIDGVKMKITADIVLEKGDRNTSVQELQNKLKQLGYLNDTADGIFGTKTETAVKAAQFDMGFEQTGKADGRFLYVLFTGI